MPAQGTTINVPDMAPATESTVSRDLDSSWLPEPVRLWVDAVASFAGVPKTMPIAAALCAAATVVQGKGSVELAPGVIVPLTLWWCVLARTGGRKSTVLKMAQAPLVAIQESEKRRLEPDISEATKRRARLEAQISRMRRATKAHVHTEGSQEHLQQLRELEHELDNTVVPVPMRWIYDNVNPAMLPMVLQRSLESDDGIARMAVWGEEGTFFANVLGRDSGKPISETLNQGYSGSSLNLVRKLDGSKAYVDVTIPEIFISICVFTQQHYREKLKNQELADNGFLGRLLISECHVGPIPERGTTVAPSPEVLQGYADWLTRLDAIPTGTVYRLSEAQQARLSVLQREADAMCMAGCDGQGWVVRSAERIARIVALAGLDEQLSGVSGVSGVSGTGPEGPRTHGDIDLEYIIYSLYSAYLPAAQSQEPAPRNAPRDAQRLSDTLTAVSKRGDIVTSRQMCRATGWPLARALDAAYELVTMGCLELDAQPVQRGARQLKDVFRVVGFL